MLKSNLRRHMPQKWISLLISLVMIFSIAFANVAFAADPVYEAPSKNAQGQFEISKPEHLMYMSQNMGTDAIPRNGTYLLMNDIDMSGFVGFVPMCKDKENGFLGVFDGQSHVIKNLNINRPGKKYVGLFGYIANEYQTATVKNLGMVNVNVLGTQNVAGLVGVSYGTVENCFVTGKIYGDNGTNPNTSGGILGKNKEGEGDIVGVVKNCYVIADIEGTFNIGGIAGQEDGGGIIENCYIAGNILARDGNGAAGGLVGAFNAGQKIANNAVLVSKITGAKDTDKIAGQLTDESGTQVTGNIVWEGTQIIGNEPVTQPIKWTDKSSKELTTKSTYTALGWNFNNTWAWKGTEDNGYPILKSFDEKIQDYKFDWTIGTVIISQPVKEVKANTEAEITARVISSTEPDSVEIYYGTTADGSTFTDKVVMQKGTGDIYTGKLPGFKGGFIYYYIKATVKDTVITKPYGIKNSIQIFIDDGTIFGQPKEISISLDQEQSSVRVNWITIPAIKDTVVQYGKKEKFDEKDKEKYKEIKGTSYIVAVTPGFNERMSHKAVMKNLEPDTTYIYRVGDGKGFMSDWYEFKSPPQEQKMDKFTFLFMSDPQSVSLKDYESTKFSYNYALTQLPNPAFTVLTGDITESGYKTVEWSNFFTSVQDKLATIPIMPSLGTHDFKCDPQYLTFKSRFNVPDNGPEGDLKGTAYWYEYGDALFINLNTEAVPSTIVKPNIDKQLEWMEALVNKTDKKWKIVTFHTGPYTSNHNDEYIRDIVGERFDKMKIDLVLTGHDHMYIRSSMKGDQKVGLGEGTTYVTGGTVGNKYYDYLDRAKRWTEVYSDKKDCQTVNFVTVSKDKIEFKAMQRVEPKSNEFKQIDCFELTNSLAESKKEISKADDLEPAA